jgi:hypothetical protein
MDPGDFQILDVAGVDLIERAIAPSVIGLVIRQPVIGLPAEMRAVSTGWASAGAAVSSVATATVIVRILACPLMKASPCPPICRFGLDLRDESGRLSGRRVSLALRVFYRRTGYVKAYIPQQDSSFSRIF